MCYGKSFITYMLRPEGCFGHLSAWLHFVRLRTEKRLAEIEKSFA